ncbi:MAG: hypothetical protein IKD75_14560 [Prevotella sp.]|nr:hypothetical protein [Prevotella sp.]
MKKLFFALMMLTVTISANAMSYEQARNEALFLTDKMAYELNLTDEQYEAAYEINLDYLMGVTSRDDVYGVYWERRNLDLSYILLDWQWNAFVAANYFYRPLYWDAGYWHFGIYLRYPHRDYFYFGRPHFYATYRGGHAWHRHGGHGYYHGHSNHYRAPHRAHYGMHDRYNHGDFRGPRHSSTRITGRPHGGQIDGRHHDNGSRRIENHGNRHGSSNFSGPRSGSNEMRNNAIRHNELRSNNSVRHNEMRSSNNEVRHNSHSGSGSFSGSRSGSSHSSGSFSGSHSGGSRSGGSFSGSRSGGSHSSFSGTRGGSSHGGGFSSHGGSHGGGSHSGGSHGHGGGGRMGGHR